MYQPIHSDFLIHWTGRDIDHKNDRSWSNKNSSKTSPAATKLYLDTIKGTLKFGLWMTRDKADRFVRVEGKKIKRPWTARTCFTELKLSEARSHAERFGRLGIGFKRFFLFNRFGAPMVYYQPLRKNWFFPPYITNRYRNITNPYFACFLKSMGKKSYDGTLQYKYFDESEWRIIYSKEVEATLKKCKREDITQFFMKPEDYGNEFQEYLEAVKARITPEYLIPLVDRWFSMIIYPSLEVKVKAEADPEIRALIQRLKPTKPSGRELKDAQYEAFSKPMEIDLDACRNF